jgi:hypothetical protein
MHRRVAGLDALRGLMLLWITGTHLPTRLSAWVNQPFGFFAGTEGFIFLSALFTGLISYRIAARAGWAAMCRRLWARAGRLYAYHLALLAVAFGIGAKLAAGGSRPALHNLLDFYYAAGRTRAYLDAALLLYRPPLLDILPIYIIFLALSPVALALGLRRGWRYAFAGGIAIWLLAQVGLRSFTHAVLESGFGLRIPIGQMGAFDLWAWQLWWLIGLWMGVRWGRGDLRVEYWARRLAPPAAIVSGAFLVVRYAQLVGLVELGRSAWILDKWNLGPGRIVDFAAAAALTVRFRSVLEPLAVAPLVRLGRASLEVFCVHLLCVFFALLLLGERPLIQGWSAIALVAGSWAAMALTAEVVARAERRVPGGGPRAPAPPSEGRPVAQGA